MSLDFDMQELTGEITPEELEDKKGKVKLMMDKINKQIQEIENMFVERKPKYIENNLISK
jgi:hypothetical protein